MPSSDQKILAILSHISANFCPIIVALIVFLVSKDDYVRKNAKEALVFQCGVAIAGVISVILCIVIIGFFLLIALGILNLIFSIIASIAAFNGTEYSYPVTGQFAAKL